MKRDNVRTYERHPVLGAAGLCIILKIGFIDDIIPK
jgi:hypothetical protein